MSETLQKLDVKIGRILGLDADGNTPVHAEMLAVAVEIEKKNEMIKVLADALWESGDAYPQVGWHTAICIMEGVGAGKRCTEICAMRRSALRLAGRLP